MPFWLFFKAAFAFDRLIVSISGWPVTTFEDFGYLIKEINEVSQAWYRTAHAQATVVEDVRTLVRVRVRG